MEVGVACQLWRVVVAVVRGRISSSREFLAVAVTPCTIRRVAGTAAPCHRRLAVAVAVAVRVLGACVALAETSSEEQLEEEEEEEEEEEQQQEEEQEEWEEEPRLTRRTTHAAQP
jgi:mannose/fructose/N-acetylgalactosamine-specific phosphotransferase system component IIC